MKGWLPIWEMKHLQVDKEAKRANILANEILVASRDIISFPVQVKKVIKEWTDIQICSFA